MDQHVILRSLQMTFGNIPLLIEENMKYIEYNDSSDDFTCVPCDKIIKKGCNSDSTTINFEKHLIGNSHKTYTVTDYELKKNLYQTFDGKIPQIVQNNWHVLGMDSNGNYRCEICDKVIQTTRFVSSTENNFSYHLLSSTHEDNLENYRDGLGELYYVYGRVPLFVLNHSQFLNRNGKDYYCNICEKHIQVHPSEVKETEISFEKHLHSLKHMRNAKQAKAFSVIPELQQIFSYLPSYMLRNIEYMSINGANCFCSLCNENIKMNRNDVFETEHNFKFHFSSQTHEENLNSRRDPANEAFTRLHDLFDTFPDHILDNLKYLSVDREDFFCNICRETITVEGFDNDETEGNLICHLESDDHTTNVEMELDRRSELIEDLKQVFGGMPLEVQDNINHIVYKDNNVFECVLCDKTIKTANSVKMHLINSKKHNDKLNDDEECENDFLRRIEELFNAIPQYIQNNLTHLGCDYYSDNFYCYLCDKEITLVNGSKKEELTAQNFRSHLLSVGHMAKLKHKANLRMEASEQLERVYYKIPNFILNNLEYIEKKRNQFFCSLCDKRITNVRARYPEQEFREHISKPCHRENAKSEEHDSEEALQRLDFMFWRLPEIMLRNIDFLDTVGNDLFCLLCQETLTVDEDDLDTTKQLFRTHMESEKHEHNLKNM